MSRPEPGALELEGVGHAWGEQAVLEDIRVRLEPGQVCALLGPNGAGKSTLLRVAAGLMTPARGRARLGGQALEEMSRRELARRRAYLGQAAPQVFDFTALELVLMGGHARSGRWSLPGRAARARAEALLEELGLGALGSRPAPTLSGGELQRVLLAQALASQAPWLMLDEPTSSLDVRHRLEVLERVRRHTREGGAALVVLHDLELIEAFADQVLVLHERALAAQGPPAEALTEELLSGVFEAPTRSVRHRGRRLWYLDVGAPGQ